jgi:hypothetical protein
MFMLPYRGVIFTLEYPATPEAASLSAEQYRSRISVLCNRLAAGLTFFVEVKRRVG